MTADELVYLGAAEARALFAERELSPVELMTAVLERAAATAKDVNSFTALYPEQALEQAREAEERYARDGAAARPLEGLPVAFKELTPVAGQQHTLACLALKDNVATQSAPSAARVIAAGGIVHGRTTTPEFGCASHTHSRLYGITRNPWNLDFSPCGSSGGSASALATGATTLAEGTDSAGSLRLPAASCGVVGYKPPSGRVPGLQPLNLETCHHDGPMARTVADCALLLGVMAGPDPVNDPGSILPPLDLEHATASVRGLRVAVLDTIDGLDVDTDVAANLRSAVDALRDQGVEIEEADLGWRFEHIDEAAKLHFAATYGPMVQRITDAFPDLVTSYAADFAKKEARLAAERPGYLLRANELIAELWAPLARLFERVDALLLPTLVFPAPPLGEEYLDDGPVVNGVEQPDRWTAGFTVAFDLCSWTPAMNVPSGFARNGIPTGVQIAGRPYDDATVFRIGAALEREHPWLGRRDRRPVAVTSSTKEGERDEVR